MQHKAIKKLHISRQFISAFIIGFILVASIAYYNESSTLGYIASLSLFSFVATFSLTSRLLAHEEILEASEEEEIKEESKKEANIEDIEKNILDALEAYNIEAMIKELDNIASFNKSAKKKATQQIIDFESAKLVPLYKDTSRSLIIFPPPDTINPNEGEEFVMRLSVPCAIIDDKSKVETANDLFKDYFNNIKIHDNLSDKIVEKEKFENSLMNAEHEKYIDPIKFQIKDSQTYFLLSINKITKSKEPKYLCQAVDITNFIYDESKQVQNQKMQAVGQLAGSVAHDFNNLLTAMIGFCDILLEQYGPTDTGFHETMQIKQNANRAAELVKQLLAFSRKQVLNLDAVDINEIIIELANLLKRLLGESINIKIDCHRHLKPAMTDKNQLEQVIINLCVNARDAMNGKGNLLIKTSEITIDKNYDETILHAPTKFENLTPGTYDVIEITDSGSGIPSDIIESIFEPFFSTKEPGSGTGLGLSTVHGIVKQIGGHVRLKTEMGKGTSFFIFLEQAKEKKKTQALRDNIEMSLISDLLKKDRKEQKTRILIVEDEEPVRMFEAHALRSKGFSVVDMEDGFKAIDFLKEDGENIDVVITDVIMPGMTGPEMVEKVKDLYPHIKFLFTSGYTEEALEYFDNNDHHHFLSKPFSLDTLINMINNIIKQDDNK